MKKHLTLSASTALLAGIFLTSSCSSDDDSPPNAITINSTNAEAIVQSAAGSTTALSSALAVETIQFVSLRSTLDIIKPLIQNIADNSTANVATGIDFSEPCSGGGSQSGSGTQTDDALNYSDSGTSNFNNCVEAGFTINGSMSFSDSGNYVTGAYTDTASGSLTMSFNGRNDSFSFTGFVFSITGNNQLFTYTINQLTYAINFVINGTSGGGFLVSLTAPIIESNGSGCPESGHITITGGNGTTAEGIYNSDGTMTIKANGAGVTTVPICYI